MIVSEEFPKNLGIYIRIDCYYIEIFCLIGREDKVLSIRDKNYKMSIAETAFGARYRINGTIARTYIGATFINRKTDSTISLSDTACGTGLPHATRYAICLGSIKANNLSIREINNYYWTSRFKRKHFGQQFKFLKTQEIRQDDTQNKSSDVLDLKELTLLKYGKKVLITDENRFKNKARVEISVPNNDNKIYLL